jgi:hypothetical protein
VDDFISAFLADTQAALPLVIWAKRAPDTSRAKNNKTNNLFMQHLS